MKYLIDRSEIIHKRAALIRQGIRPAFLSNLSYRIHERMNIKPIIQGESTTHKSPIISRVYNSVFCEKLTNPEWRE